jgi:hypothetical protein
VYRSKLAGVTSDNSHRILIPLPNRDFDPSEVAISWRALRDAGHKIGFATPDGSGAAADPRMLSGATQGIAVLGRA